MSYGAWDVTVRLGSHTVLDAVTLAAAPGEISVVVGGDGAGKSTLLRTLVGRVRPAAGEVRLPPDQEIGYTPAAAGSWPELTVAENVEFVGSSYGLRGDRLAARSDELLTRAGLAGARDRPAARLSGGMRTKLGFVLAMLHEPRLLVLDEPSTGVDPVSRVDLWRLLCEAAAAGTTVVLSTTYLDEAERAAWVLVLDQGRPLLAGAPDDVVRAAPGVVLETSQVHRPAFGWRYGEAFREWWPDEAAAAGSGRPVPAGLEDVTVAASLRLAAGWPEAS